MELARGDRAAAAARARSALTAAETIRNRRDAARAKMMLGLVALSRSEPEAAIAHLTDALMVQREVEDHNGARRSLEALRDAFIATGQLERTQRLEAALARGTRGSRKRRPSRSADAAPDGETLNMGGPASPEPRPRLLTSRPPV